MSTTVSSATLSLQPVYRRSSTSTMHPHSWSTSGYRPLHQQAPPPAPLLQPHHEPLSLTTTSISNKITPLDSIITTQPLSRSVSITTTSSLAKAPPPSQSSRLHSSDRISGLPVLVSDRRMSGGPHKHMNGMNSSGQPNMEFQCPECKKTYSCRKNVKRHRMAVHKLSADDVARFPGPTPCGTAVCTNPTSAQASPVLRAHPLIPKVDPKAEYKQEILPLSPLDQHKQHNQPMQIRYHVKVKKDLISCPDIQNCSDGERIFMEIFPRLFGRRGVR